MVGYVLYCTWIHLSEPVEEETLDCDVADWKPTSVDSFTSAFKYLPRYSLVLRITLASLLRRWGPDDWLFVGMGGCKVV